MTVTTNYLVTGNGITGSTANAVQALVSTPGISRVTFIGDSILNHGYRPGALVNSGGTINAGVVAFWARIDTDVTGSGSVEYRGSDKSLRYKAPGDSAFGDWTAITKTCRQRFASANGQWIEAAIYFQRLPATDATATLGYSAGPYAARMLRGVPEWVRTLCHGAVDIVDLCVPGVLIAEVAELVPQIPARTDLVIVQAGTNNISANASQASIEADFRAVLASLSSTRALVLSMSSRGFSGGQGALWSWTNRMLPRWCAEYGVPYLSAWRHTIDQSSTTLPATGMLQADNIHPAMPGAYWAAKKILALPAFVNVGRDVPAPSPFDDYNASTHPFGNLITATVAMLQGSGGAVTATKTTAGTGGVATGITSDRPGAGTGTAVVSKVAADAGDGTEWQRLTISGSAAGETFRLEWAVGVGSAVPAVGSVVQGSAEARLVSGTVRAMEVRLRPVGTADFREAIGAFAADALNLPEAFTGVIQTPPWVVPVGATSVRHQMLVVMGGTDAVVDFRAPFLGFSTETP